MNDIEIVRELARRTSLPEETTTAVLRAMRDLVQEGALKPAALTALTLPPTRAAR